MSPHPDAVIILESRIATDTDDWNNYYHAHVWHPFSGRHVQVAARVRNQTKQELVRGAKATARMFLRTN